MSCSNIVNSAVSYYAVLGSFIDDAYELNPAGIIYPGELGAYMKTKNIRMTDAAAKGLNWMMSELKYKRAQEAELEVWKKKLQQYGKVRG